MQKSSQAQATLKFALSGQKTTLTFVLLHQACQKDDAESRIRALSCCQVLRLDSSISESQRLPELMHGK